MSISKVDYLMWGIKIDPEIVDYDKYEAELKSASNARFDLVYDSISGKYAIAGKIISQSDEYEGFEFAEVNPEELKLNSQIIEAISNEFPNSGPFKLYLFTHFY